MPKYIDVEAFLEHMKGTNRYFDVKFDIAEFPTSDVSPMRHGRWEFLKKVGVTNIYKCSMCGRIEFINESPFYNMKEKMKELYPYCHCGAKMDGGAENG